MQLYTIILLLLLIHDQLLIKEFAQRTGLIPMDYVVRPFDRPDMNIAVDHGHKASNN